MRSLGQHLADRAAMGEDHDPLVGVRGGYPLDRRPDSLRKRCRWFGSGDDVPTLLFVHPDGDGILFDQLLPEETALPVAEEHLTQIRVDCGHHGESARQGFGCLSRSSKRADVDGVDSLAGQALADQFGLFTTFG